MDITKNCTSYSENIYNTQHMDITTNCTSYSERFDKHLSSWMIVTSIALGTINLVVLIGNSLVVVAVIKYRKLRTITNVYIVSLACADMMLGILVLPFSASYDVLHFWPFGESFCSIWLAVDVLLCTASILNLCAISLDRYLAVSRPIRYPSIMSRRRGKVIVCFVWILSLIISLPPLIGWNDENNGVDTEYETKSSTNTIYGNYTTKGGMFLKNEFTVNGTECIKTYPECNLIATKGYRIYSALGSFYIPMLIMMFFYFKIYRAATKTAISMKTGILRSKTGTNASANNKFRTMDSVTLRVHRGGSCLQRSPTSPSSRQTTVPQYDKSVSSLCNIELVTSRKGRQYTSYHHNNNKRTLPYNLSDSDLKTNHFQRNFSNGELVEKVTFFFGSSNGTEARCPDSPYQQRQTNDRCSPTVMNGRKRAILFLNEGLSGPKLHARKFAKETKAAKTVAIIVGAFIICWFPFFTIYLIMAFCSDCVPPLAFSIIFWLGYCNSMINPFIYAMFSRDFRRAFRNLLFCRRLTRSWILGNSLFQGHSRKQFVLQTMDSESLSDYNVHE